MTSTKQFLWDKTRRSEERTASSVLNNAFFERGELNSGTSYYFDLDHLWTVRELLNASGITVTSYSSDPYGRTLRIQGSIDAAFGYGGYYSHNRSGLGLDQDQQLYGPPITTDPATVPSIQISFRFPVEEFQGKGTQHQYFTIPPQKVT